MELLAEANTGAKFVITRFLIRRAQVEAVAAIRTQLTGRALITEKSNGA